MQSGLPGGAGPRHSSHYVHPYSGGCLLRGHQIEAHADQLSHPERAHRLNGRAALAKISQDAPVVLIEGHVNKAVQRMTVQPSLDMAKGRDGWLDTDLRG